MPFDAIAPWELAVLALLVFCANGIEAILGFGGTLLVLAPAVLFLPIDLLVPVLLPLNLVLSMVIVWRYYDGIANRELWRLVFPAAMAGMPLGFWALAQFPVPGLKRVLGTAIIVVAVLELLRHRRRAGSGARKPLPAWAAVLWLFGGGVMQGMFLSGGPMVVYFANRNLAGKQQFRATLSALWMLLNYMLLMAHVASGRINQHTVAVSVLLFVPLLAGIFMGEKLHPRIDEDTFRVAVLVLLTLAGLAVLTS